MTQSTEQGTIWLTQDAFDKLQAELDDLKGPRRQEIIEKISAARDEGDLKENGGYHAAKDEQGKQEARIRQLEDMLRRAEVGETPRQRRRRRARHGRHLPFAGDEDDEKFLLGAREIAEDDTARRLLPAVRRWAPRSTASPRATPSPTPRPTARSSRSRSSTPCPTPADHPPSRRRWADARRVGCDAATPRLICAGSAAFPGAICADSAIRRPGSRARAAGPSPARRAARRGSRAGGAPRPRRGAASARSARARPRARSRRAAPTSPSSGARPPGRSGMQTRRLR